MESLQFTVALLAPLVRGTKNSGLALKTTVLRRDRRWLSGSWIRLENPRQRIRVIIDVVCLVRCVEAATTLGKH